MIDFNERQKFYSFLAAFSGAIIVIAWLAPGAFKVLALSFGLAYLLDPLVDKLEAKKVPRSVSILGILVLFILLVVLMVSLIIPYLWEQGIAFVNEAPELAQKALDKLAGWGVVPQTASQSVPELLEQLKTNLLAGGMDFVRPLASGLFKATSGFLGFVLAFVNLVIVPVFFFYMLRDIDIIRENFYRFVPDTVENNVRNYLGMVDGVLGGFIRGQILVALCLAVLYSAGLLITGLRFGVVIGVTAGLLSVIPYVGFLIGILVSSVVVLVDFSGWGLVFGVAATFSVSQIIEGYVLTPRFVGNRVGLTPLETLIAVLVGGQMGGFAGLLIAIPAGGIIKKSVMMLKPEGESADGQIDEEIYMADSEGEGIRQEGEGEGDA
jgi:predicted PurR-regulated permease PerM